MGMFKMNDKDALALAAWYKQNKRQLPWRDTGNPYAIWISEIMLQQTRIEAVKPKYEAFMQALPDISTLASVPEDFLLKLWEGLGYYSRARNLKKCAQVLVEQYNSQLPQEERNLLALPGIGPYTAGAISSIAYGQPVPCVDGNVMRVLSRYALSKEDIRNPKVRKQMEQDIRTLFTQIQDSDFYANFNQGIMELGETICIPNGSPNCDKCPLCQSCKAHAANQTDTIPYRSSLKSRKVINRTIFLIEDTDSYLIGKRPSKGLLANLYEFIGLDTFVLPTQITKQFPWLEIETIEPLPDAKHIFSHLEWHMKGYRLRVKQIPDVELPLVKVKKKEFANYAIPSAFSAFKSQIRD